MAFFIPNRLSKEFRSTAGERRTFQALADGLQKSKYWYVWFDVGLGRSQTHPDFVLIHPEHGLLVLEVKDWSVARIRQFGKDYVQTDTGSFRMPVEQARGYVLEATRGLSFSPPFGYGVVLPNHTRDDLDRKVNGVSWNDLVEPYLLLTKEVLEDPDRLEAHLVQLLPQQAKRRPKMTQAQFDELRRKIDPSVAVAGRSFQEADGSYTPAVISVQQERAAKSVGEGHRLMQGVAGSGKTLVMLYRAKMLAAMHPGWRILYLCWNRAVTTYLQQVYDGIALDAGRGSVQFKSYTQWAGEQCRAHGLSPDAPSTGDGHEAALVLTQRLLGHGVRPAYDAILVDEGQDFHEDFYRLVVQALNPETNSLLICYDHAQNLYQRKVSWKSLGVRVQGKRAISFDVTNDRLGTNYRNTAQIARFALALYDDAVPTKGPDDVEGEVNTLGASREQGPLPDVYVARTRREEVAQLVAWLRAQHNAGVPWHDLMVLYPRRRSGYHGFDLERDVLRALERDGIPTAWLTRDSVSKKSFGLHTDAVKVSTIHSAKGMDYEGVAAVACDLLGKDDGDLPVAEAYVAATRARRRLLLTMTSGHDAVERLLLSAHERTSSAT